VHITLFLLNANNIGWMVRFVFCVIHIFIPRKEAKLEEVLDDNSHLFRNTTHLGCFLSTADIIAS